MTDRGGRTSAEWVAFALSCLVVLTVAGLIAGQLVGGEEPPTPIASQAGPVRETANRFYLPVQVVNRGDVTASEVQVTVELNVEGSITEGDQVIDFLGGDETKDLTFVFDGEDPADGELEIRVSGFAIP